MSDLLTKQEIDDIFQADWEGTSTREEADDTDDKDKVPVSEG